MNQTQLILKHLKSGKKLTAMQALDKFGCFRLAARVRDLKDIGLDVKKTTIEKNGKKFAQYYL